MAVTITSTSTMITCDGAGSVTLDDIVSATTGCTKTGTRQYYMTKGLTISGGANFTASNLEWHFYPPDTLSEILTVDGSSSFTLGLKDGSGYGYSGVDWFIETAFTDGGTASIFSDDGSTGTIKIYASKIAGYAPNCFGLFFRVYSGSSQVVELIDNQFVDFPGGGRFQGSDSIVKRNKFINSSTTISPFTIKYPVGTLSDIEVVSSDNAFYWSPSISDDTTFTNLKARGCTYWVSVNDVTPGVTKSLSLVDSDVDSKTLYWGTYVANNTIYEKYNYVPTIVDISDQSPIESARVAAYNLAGSQVFNDTTDSNGEVGDILLNAGYYTEAGGSTRTDQTPHTIRVGKYGYFFQNFPITMSSRIVSNQAMTENAFVVAVEATAGAYTGITVDGSAQTITLGEAHTLQEVYDYCQAWVVGSGNIQYDEPITTVDGLNFALASGWTFYDPGEYLDTESQVLTGPVILTLDTAGTYSNDYSGLADLTIDMTDTGTFDFRSGTFHADGVTVDSSNDSTITAQFSPGVSVTNDNATYITVESSVAITVSNANLADDSRVRLYNVTQDAELDNSVVSGGSGYSYNATVGAGEEVEVDDTIRIQATYASGSTYKENYEESAVASTSNMTFIGTQTAWANANSLSVDGSAQTEFAADYPNIQVDVTASGNLFNVADLIGWILYDQTTADGIRNFYGAISSKDATNWTINTSVVDLYLDNVSATSATQDDTIILMRDDSAYPQVTPTSGGGGIGMIQSGLVFLAETGISGLTSAESAQLSATVTTSNKILKTDDDLYKII